MKHITQVQQINILLKDFYEKLEVVTENKLSIGECTVERLIWEFTNKTFSILVTLENSLKSKDSLTTHLICRFSYEMLLVFSYIILDPENRDNRVRKFLEFDQFQTQKRQWDDASYSEMISKLPDPERFSFHKKHYRHLSNFAHPTKDSFMLNRRGEQSEYLMIAISTILAFTTLLEIIKICREENFFFTVEQFQYINLEDFFIRADVLMKSVDYSEIYTQS